MLLGQGRITYFVGQSVENDKKIPTNRRAIMVMLRVAFGDFSKWGHFFPGQLFGEKE